MRAALPTEPYAAVSEFVEIALAPAWTELDTQLTDALRSAPAAPDAAVVDIGAGGGRGVLAAARALPSGSIVAVEPSAPLRAVLLSRLALDPALRERTTVLATDLAGAELPARWSAALVLNMAGHLDPPERRGLWRTAAERLLPGAPLLVTVQPPFAVTTVPEMDWGRVRVGAHTLTTSGSAEPDGPDSVRWTIAYRVLDGERLLREERLEHRWYVQDPVGLTVELADAGLRAEVIGERLVRAERPGGRR